MRVLVGRLILVLAIVLAAPKSSTELRSRYGPPDMERYIVRPGIGLTVEYGADGVACRMTIQAHRALNHKAEEAKLISMDTVKEILLELIPPGERGAFTGPGVSVVSSKHSIASEIYERVTIFHELTNCESLRPACEVSATVSFSHPVCDDSPK